MYRISFLVVTVVLFASASAQFYTPGNDERCARMWDALNYEGNAVDCANNERKLNLGTFDCKVI